MTPSEAIVPTCIHCGPECLVGFGKCHCGCKNDAPIAKDNYPRKGHIAGLPVRFISGHNNRHPRPDLSNATPFKIEGVYCRLIPLTQGMYAIVNAEDYEWLAVYTWSAVWSPSTKSFRAMRQRRIPDTKKCISTYMHDVILGIEYGSEVMADHVDSGKTWDNRRKNLRIVDAYGNSLNQRIRSNNRSGRKGVSFHKATGKWAPCITVNGKKIYFKECDAFEEACLVREEAERKYHGEFARAR